VMTTTRRRASLLCHRRAPFGGGTVRANLRPYPG
jgi:hypothetical protein